ncbi:uncharacterized protein LOC115057918 isoform X2 [Echeneis naucrates]|uniref:DBIRD complex subunit ZNF326 n=1 Tax=Echeneis naucrates TaxID=173247 RepID=A0A665UGJ3_ECHNA|nr:DBIRD complex subunit ZNF326 isoform X2 [Echeneis naucrates]
MNRQANAPFSSSAYQQLPGRVPKDFMEAMKRIPVRAPDPSTPRTPDMAAAHRAAQPSAGKWKSSFKPVGEEDDESTTTSEKAELYDPYDPGSSDSEMEVAQSKDFNQSTSDQDNKTGSWHLSPGRGCCVKRRWDSACSVPVSQPFDRCDRSSETRPSENRGLSSRSRLSEVYNPGPGPLDRPGYTSTSRPLEHRACSPEMIVHSASAQQFPASYGGQKSNGDERKTATENKRETATTVRLSPPKLQMDYQHRLGLMDADLEKVIPATEVTRKRSKTTIMDQTPITCDLCEVELSNGQELEEHLDSRSHWATLEHIQQNNNYDDLAIAFLQEVMLYKSRQCSRAIEDSALQALQENDFMTKVDMFHCAACKVLVSTSASAVQTHITSQEHLYNTKDFEVQQRRTCLDKAETIMKELKPHFEFFTKGDNPFE